MKKIDGWIKINDRTTLITKAGKPVLLRSSARDLDREMDLAGQFFGEPIEGGDWRPREPDCICDTHTGKKCHEACEWEACVMTSADAQAS